MYAHVVLALFQILMLAYCLPEGWGCPHGVDLGDYSQACTVLFH